jgi:hypothetical protein
MAEIKNLHAEIELTNPYSSGHTEKSQPMPRMDTCHNCGRARATHTEGHCLFESTSYKPRDQSYESFRSEFMSWIQGQRLEDGLCNIVYELTRGDR